MARKDVFGELGVVHGNAARLREVECIGGGNDRTLIQLHSLPVPEPTRSDLGTCQVNQDGYGLPIRRRRLANRTDHFGQVFGRCVSGIEANHVHAGIDHGRDSLGRGRGWAQGADNLRPPSRIRHAARIAHVTSVLPLDADGVKLAACQVRMGR